MSATEPDPEYTVCCVDPEATAEALKEVLPPYVNSEPDDPKTVGLDTLEPHVKALELELMAQDPLLVERVKPEPEAEAV